MLFRTCSSDTIPDSFRVIVQSKVEQNLHERYTKSDCVSLNELYCSETSQGKGAQMERG